MLQFGVVDLFTIVMFILLVYFLSRTAVVVGVQVYTVEIGSNKKSLNTSACSSL